VKNRAYHSLNIADIPLLGIRLMLALVTGITLSQCATGGPKPSQATNVVVSVKQQKLALYNKSGKIGKTYPVSTSKFGLSDKPGTYGTPLGLHEVVAKIGHGARPGTVFKSRRPTGEIIKPDAPGRDPIVSRIMWLRGLESKNKNAYGRCIYIHGTAAEKDIGKAASYGCIRMKSKDVIDLFNNMGIGSRVLIVQGGLPGEVPVSKPIPVRPVPSSAPPIFLNPQQAPPQKSVPQLPEPEPAAEPAKKFVQPMILAQNDTNSIPSEGSSPAPNPYQVKQMANGASVIYSAPGSSAPVILKSKRSPLQSAR
jgi:hypothetical protein